MDAVDMIRREEILELRSMLGLPQHVFGALVGAPSVLVSKWERGHRIPTAYQRSLLRAFVVRVRRTGPSSSATAALGREVAERYAGAGLAAALVLMLSAGSGD